MDPLQVVKDAVFEAVSAINPNTVQAYPDTLFTGHDGIALPLTVYEVSLGDSLYLTEAQDLRRVDVEVRLDHFGESQAQLSSIAHPIKMAVLAIMPTCTTDTPSQVSGLCRRSQRFTGTFDTGANIMYKR